MKLVTNVFLNGGEERAACITCLDTGWLKLGEMGGTAGDLRDTAFSHRSPQRSPHGSLQLGHMICAL